MPYVISGDTDDDRFVITERTREVFRAFYAPLSWGEPLTPELLALTPDPYYVKPKGGLPEIFGENLGVWIIKDSVKQIIEALEPGVHTFISVNLRVRGSKRNWGQYYLLYPGQAIDAVVIDETDFAEGKGRPGFEADPDGLGPHPILSSLGDTVLDGTLVGGRHLWRGAWGKQGRVIPFWQYLFTSDELTDRIREAGIEGWQFRRCKLKQDT